MITKSKGSSLADDLVGDPLISVNIATTEALSRKDIHLRVRPRSRCYVVKNNTSVSYPTVVITEQKLPTFTTNIELQNYETRLKNLSRQMKSKTYKTTSHVINYLFRNKGRMFWDEPLINVGYDGEAIIEWWHDAKKLTIEVLDTNISFIKVWGVDIDDEMEDGIIKDDYQLNELWKWISN